MPAVRRHGTRPRLAHPRPPAGRRPPHHPTQAHLHQSPQRHRLPHRSPQRPAPFRTHPPPKPLPFRSSAKANSGASATTHPSEPAASPANPKSTSTKSFSPLPPTSPATSSPHSLPKPQPSSPPTPAPPSSPPSPGPPTSPRSSPSPQASATSSPPRRLPLSPQILHPRSQPKICHLDRRPRVLRPQSGFSDPQAESPSVQLLACTFVDQKFPHRTPRPRTHPPRLLRRRSPPTPSPTPPTTPSRKPPLPSSEPNARPHPRPHHTPPFRRLPRSLTPIRSRPPGPHRSFSKPLVANLPGLHLLGNAYRGVGLPDLIRDARSAAQSLLHPSTTA